MNDLTVKELLEWVIRAQEWYEKNWTDEKGCSPKFKTEAILATKPENANAVDFEIAKFFINSLCEESQFWLAFYSK